MSLGGRIFAAAVLVALLGFAGKSRAQSCQTSSDLDAATKNSLTAAGNSFFDMVKRGDSASLQRSSIASIATNFSGVEAAIKENQANLATASGTARPPYLLKAEGTAPIARAEFLCGVFGANGQTASSAVFVIPNLPPGNYAVVIMDAATPAGPYVVSFVLQQLGNDWKVGGFYVKAAQVKGHDGNWFADQARAYKTKGQLHNAWLYFLQARELLVAVPFMSTQATDKLFDEAQGVQPPDVPGNGPVDLVAGPKTYKLNSLFPLPVGKDLDLVVKYNTPDVSNTAQVFQENMNVMKALLIKFPELRQGFDGLVARAVEPSGRDYGSMLPVAQIK